MGAKVLKMKQKNEIIIINKVITEVFSYLCSTNKNFIDQ